MKHENYTSIEGFTTEPELRGSENKVLTFTVVNTETYKRKDSDDVIENTVYLDCVVFGAYAESLSKWLKQGDHVKVVGRLSQDTWEDKETNQKRSKIQLKCSNVNIYTSKAQREYLKTMPQ